MKHLSLFLIVLLAMSSCGAIQDEKPKKEKYQLTSKEGRKCFDFEWAKDACIDREEFRAIGKFLDEKLAKFKKGLDSEAIGEYFVVGEKSKTGSVFTYSGQEEWVQPATKGKWYKFWDSNVKDEIDGYIKIGYTWYPKNDVIIYEDGYEDLREQIGTRLKEEDRAK